MPVTLNAYACYHVSDFSEKVFKVVSNPFFFAAPRKVAFLLSLELKNFTSTPRRLFVEDSVCSRGVLMLLG